MYGETGTGSSNPSGVVHLDEYPRNQLIWFLRNSPIRPGFTR